MSCAKTFGKAKNSNHIYSSHMVLVWKVLLHTKQTAELNLYILTDYLVTQKFLQLISGRAAFQSPFDLTSRILTILDISYLIGRHRGSLDCTCMTGEYTWN